MGVNRRHQIELRQKEFAEGDGIRSRSRSHITARSLAVLFVCYLQGSAGLVDIQGGRLHLWLAIAMGLIACVAAFFVLSAFAQHDKEDELHITLNS